MKTRTSILLLLLLAALMASACSTPTPLQPRETPPLTPEVTPATTPTPTPASAPTPFAFTDALGHTVFIEKTDTVAALMGSYAELWLLAGGQLAGVTDDAYSERGLTLSSDVALLGSYKTPSVESVISLSPDMTLLSADTDEHIALYETLHSAGVNPVYLSVKQFSEYLDALKLLTDLTGRSDLYEQNGVAIQARVDAAIESAKGKQAPSVLFIRAFSSGYKALDKTSMTGAMLYDLGADNIADRQPSLLKELSMEAILAADPDFILVVTMGADHQKALDALRQGLMDNPAWSGLTAVKENRYVVLPRELFHYKPNARWGESYENLASILYGN